MEKPLRIVAFSMHPVCYEPIFKWVQDKGHKLVLLVTTPGPKSRPNTNYKDVIAIAPRDLDILVTTRLRKVATPLIRELKPDLIVSFGFSYRITPELIDLPTFGAINIHPALLPAYRGKNVLRQLYEDNEFFGTTVHWMSEEFDAGNILSQKAAPIPENATQENIFPVWRSLHYQALVEAAEKAIAGDPGMVQDESQASIASEFTEEETWLDWGEPKRTIQRKFIALSWLGIAKANIDGQAYRILELELISEIVMSADVGQVIERSGDKLVVQTADGPVRIQVEMY